MHGNLGINECDKTTIIIEIAVNEELVYSRYFTYLYHQDVCK